MVILIAVLAGIGFTLAVRALAAANEARAEAAHPPEGQFVEVDGVRIHAVVMGSGPDLVLLHGAGGSTRDYTFAFAERLSTRYRVIAMDRPGLGYSGRLRDYSVWSREAETPREQARLLQAAAAQLGAEKPIVLGHSFGAIVALAWALERPENISGVISVGGVANPWEGGVGGFYDLTASPLGGALFVPLATAFVWDGYLQQSVTNVFRPQSEPEGYGAHFGPRMSARRETLRANGRQVHGLKPYVIEMVQDYPGITVPVEIVHGDADTTVPLQVHSIPLSEQVPGANLTVLPGVGHMPQHADPDAVEAAIDRAATRAGLR
ncbi:MAG: alpha/beta hydrolase [Pseudomonadota bacterium]